MNELNYDPVKRKYVIKYSVAGHEVTAYLSGDASEQEITSWRSHHLCACRQLVLEKLSEDAPKTRRAVRQGF
jgi:hypothetical protein